MNSSGGAGTAAAAAVVIVAIVLSRATPPAPEPPGTVQRPTAQAPLPAAPTLSLVIPADIHRTLAGELRFDIASVSILPLGNVAAAPRLEWNAPGVSMSPLKIETFSLPVLQ